MGIVTFALSLNTAPAWIPTDLAGLALWAKGGTVLYDGSNYIYSAPDGSGNSNDASQGTAANQPLRAAAALNGKDVIPLIEKYNQKTYDYTLVDSYNFELL